MAKTRINLTVDTPTLERLRAYSQRTGVSQSRLVQDAVTRELDQRESTPKEIVEKLDRDEINDPRSTHGT